MGTPSVEFVVYQLTKIFVIIAEASFVLSENKRKLHWKSFM